MTRARIHGLLTIVTVVTIAIGCVRPQHAAIPDAELLSIASNVSAGRLENGLQYFVITDEEKEIGLGIDAGLLHEEDGHSGVALLVPRVLVRSVRSADPDDHEPWARADNDMTEIMLSEVHDVNRDIARFRTWLDAELTEKAFADVHQPKPQDRDQSWDDDDLVRFSGTRLIRHPWRGLPQDVGRLDLAALRRFRSRWYVPSRMTLIVRGPWKRSEVIAVIEQQFSTLRDRHTPRDPKLIEARRGVVVTAGCCYLRISFLRDNPPPRSRQDIRAALVRELFERALIDRLRDATTIWGTDSGLSASLDEAWLSQRVVSFEMQLVTDVRKDISAALLARELERVRLYGFTADELRRAREPERPPPPGIVVDYSYGDRHCSHPVERTLRGFLPISCDAEKQLASELLPTISDAEINGHRSSIDPRNAAFGAISSERGSATAESIQTAITRAVSQPIPRWNELPPLMAARPHPGRIVRESRSTTASSCGFRTESTR